MSSASEPSAPVRWGLLSAANIGVKAVLPAIRASRNGRLVAVASRDRARAERIAGGNGDVKVYDNYEALLEDSAVEAIYIPLPNSLHAGWTVRAALHRKHVLCEKPLGATTAEVRDMIAACREARVLLMEAFMYRFHPQIRWTLEQLAAGVIGQVHRVRAAFAFDIRQSPENIRLFADLAGGSLMDVGCYPLNFSRAVFGGPPRVIAARAHAPARGEVERTVAAVLDFGEGHLSLIDSSFELPLHQYAEVIGDEGRVFLNRPFSSNRVEAVVRVEHGEEVVERRFAPIDQYQLEVEHFADCIRTGAAPYLSPEDSLEQAETIEAIYAAAGYSRPW
jgi:D-xylose 1-dehydrogenase (NADP+, D-xylono-1,5-lactone-forming)